MVSEVTSFHVALSQLTTYEMFMISNVAYYNYL